MALPRAELNRLSSWRQQWGIGDGAGRQAQSEKEGKAKWESFQPLYRNTSSRKAASGLRKQGGNQSLGRKGKSDSR